MIKKPQQTKEERWQQQAEVRDALNTIDIRLIFEALGADPNQDHDRSKWKIHGKGNVITKGQAWQNTVTQKKGFGGVGLVRMALDFEYEKDAIDWIMERFADSVDLSVKQAVVKMGERKAFSPPEDSPSTIRDVRNYLVYQRMLPPSLIDKWIKEGKIYSDPGKNCVFLAPASAEIRSTVGPDFKGCCEGSQVETSGFRIPQEKNADEKIFALNEAAVDALSYQALYPGRFVMSTNGAGRFVLQYNVILEVLDVGYQVRVALDADPAGDISSQRLFNALYLRVLLSNQLKIDPEQVDEWFLKQKITFEIAESPHELFFNHGWSPEKEVLEMQDYEEHGVKKTRLVSTGRMAPPQIRIHVEKDLHPMLKRGIKCFMVSERGYQYVTEKMRVNRDRPVNFKDWNDELKNLGGDYTQKYEVCAAKRFSEGVPVLPDYLEKYRGPSAKKYTPVERGILVKEEVKPFGFPETVLSFQEAPLLYPGRTFKRR